MKQGKTEYRFKVNGDMLQVENVIRNWLMVNEFEVKHEYGSTCYAFNDPIIKGKRGFEYFIHGDEVTILAYIGTYKKPCPLEGAAGAWAKQSYKNELTTLFEEIKKWENGNGSNTTDMYGTPAEGFAQVQTDSLNTFVARNEQSKETLVIVGFVMSIIGLALSCFGMFGIILAIFEFYFAIQGLKTSKRGLAIATIVLASVSILITIGYVAIIFLAGLMEGMGL